MSRRLATKTSDRSGATVVGVTSRVGVVVAGGAASFVPFSPAMSLVAAGPLGAAAAPRRLVSAGFAYWSAS